LFPSSAEITKDKNEIRRLKTIANLAEGAARENQSEMEVANHRIIQLEVQLNAAKRGAENANESVHTLSASVNRLDEEVRSVSTERDISTRENKEVLRGLVVGLAMQRKGLKEVRMKWRVAEAGLEGSKGMLMAAATETEEVKNQLAEANNEAATKTTRLAEIEALVNEATARITQLEAELADAVSQLAISEGGRQEALTTATSRQESHDATLQELTASRDAALERISALEMEVSDLFDKLSIAERTRLETVHSAETVETKATQLQARLDAMNGEKAALQGEVAALVESLGESDQAHADEIAGYDTREKEAIARAESLTVTLASREAEAESLRHQADGIKAELYEITLQLSPKDTRIAEGETTIGDLRNQLESAHEEHAEMERDLSTRLEEVQNLQKAVEGGKAELQRLVTQASENERVLTERDSLSIEIIQLKIAMEGKERSLMDAREELEMAGKSTGDAARLAKKIERLEDEARGSADRLREKEIEVSTM
jgi:chromosome segregation ATPase